MAVQLLYYFFLSLAIFLLTMKVLRTKRRINNLPPGPPRLPIIGNLHHLKPRLHRSFHALSQTYGHIISLWFGSRLVVVVSSPSLAQQCLTKYDTVLANRPRFLTGKYLFYDYTSLVFSSNGDHWRNLRRIATIDVLSVPRLNSFFQVRRDEVMRLIRKLGEDTSMGFTKVELRPRITEMSFNNMMRMISAKTSYKEDDDEDWRNAEEARQFKEIIAEILSLVDANNKSDFLPFLSWFDFDGFVKRLKSVGKRADTFWQGLLEHHRSANHCYDTMIDHLLTLQKTQPHYYSDRIIKGLIQDMLLAGTNTTILAIEWAMSALLNHPEILKKAKDELNTLIGNDRLVDESDIPNLPYLQNIIYETLRLYSPSPLLLPHFSSDECNIEGFTIPRDAIVLINSWAMRRDPKTWSDAESFKPERFEIEGEANKLITFAFGLGRRACPGYTLAHRIMGWTLGLLIQCFEWKRLSEEDIDMREDIGFTFAKLIPLEALCQALPISATVVKQY